MSGDDDYERLLREVDAATSGAATPPARRQDASPATRTTGTSPATTGSPLRTGVVAGVVCGAGVGTLTFLFSWLPFVDNPVSSGMGAFIGAFLTGTVVSWRRGR